MTTKTTIAQRVREEGFSIKSKNFIDHIGIGWIVKISKEGKSTQRRARRYGEAL